MRQDYNRTVHLPSACVCRDIYDRGIRAQEDLLRARMDEHVALSTLAANGADHQSGMIGDAYPTVVPSGASAGVVHTGYPQAYGEIQKSINGWY